MKKVVEYKSIEDIFNYKWTKRDSFISFIWYRPKRCIVDTFYKIKYACQRARKDYDSRDIFSMDAKFVKRYLAILKDFQETKHGYPPQVITFENWSNIIQQMIDDLQFIDDNMYEYDTEKDNECIKRKDHFFYLFSTYFFTLWD